MRKHLGMQDHIPIVASGSMPDLVGFPGTDTRFYQWAEDGAFLPLDDYLAHYETLGNIPDYIYNSFKVDGKIYGIPRYSKLKLEWRKTNLVTFGKIL